MGLAAAERSPKALSKFLQYHPLSPVNRLRLEGKILDRRLFDCFAMCVEQDPHLINQVSFDFLPSQQTLTIPWACISHPSIIRVLVKCAKGRSYIWHQMAEYSVCELERGRDASQHLAFFHHANPTIRRKYVEVLTSLVVGKMMHNSGKAETAQLLRWLNANRDHLTELKLQEMALEHLTSTDKGHVAQLRTVVQISGPITCQKTYQRWAKVGCLSMHELLEYFSIR